LVSNPKNPADFFWRGAATPASAPEYFFKKSLSGQTERPVLRTGVFVLRPMPYPVHPSVTLAGHHQSHKERLLFPCFLPSNRKMHSDISMAN